MKNTTLLLLLFSGILLFSNCKKDNLVNGTVRDLGPVELDGCGWVILIGSETFKPINLSSQFQQDELEIQLSYDETGGMANCGLQSDAFAKIEINEIE